MTQLLLAGHRERHGLEELLRLFLGTATSPWPIRSSLVQEPGQSRVRTELAGRVIERQVDSHFAKREIKRQLYQLLADQTGHKFPWGSLTGVRPTFIAAELLQLNPQPDWVKQQLILLYQLDPAKASLAVKTAQAEMKILEQALPAGQLLYVSVPFCPSRCSYCSFTSQAGSARQDLYQPYVQALLQEARILESQLQKPLQALYLGGGTPTCLPPGLLDQLLEGLFALLPKNSKMEFTVEAGRPDTLGRESLAVLAAYPVTRLCINPQTFHDDTLKRIGRQHTVKQLYEAWQLALAYGFTNLNLDLIAGLPGETPSDLAFSLNKALQLDAAGISLHSLALKRGARLKESADKSPLLPQPAWQAMTATAEQLLAEHDFWPYYLYKQKYALGGLENTGFAQPGRECFYNVAMMSDQVPVLGLGSFAVSKKITQGKIERQTSPRDLKTYLERVPELAAAKASWFNQALE